MSGILAVSEWEQIVSRQMPQLSRPQAAVLAQRCRQASVVAVVAGMLEQSESTVRQRLREWRYAASDKAGSRRGQPCQELVVATCFAPLLR